MSEDRRLGEWVQADPRLFPDGTSVLDWDEAPDLVTALVPIPFDTAPLVAAERAAATHRLSMSTREQSR